MLAGTLYHSFEEASATRPGVGSGSLIGRSGDDFGAHSLVGEDLEQDGVGDAAIYE